jgi:hypothetical protein
VVPALDLRVHGWTEEAVDGWLEEVIKDMLDTSKTYLHANGSTSRTTGRD